VNHVNLNNTKVLLGQWYNIWKTKDLQHAKQQ
jgi:hypothetical protein